MYLPVYSNHNSHEMKQKHRIRADSALPNKRREEVMKYVEEALDTAKKIEVIQNERQTL